jgi:tRNA(Arg) A34 adenosine deaminase TadA
VNTRLPVEELVELVLRRSRCHVQMGAVLYDRWGVFAWGWNHAGNGNGEHAELHAIRRANRVRLRGATIAVAGRYATSRSMVEAKPCARCYGLLRDVGVRRVRYRRRDGQWCMLDGLDVSGMI